jgi:mannose/fructose/N-acetylgalactosamine-specific phosphotransferase system component IIB
MPLVLVRIDDRLIHGQVVVGWGIHLNPDRIILSSDEIANSSWEKEIYMGAEATAPFPLAISVLTIDETILFLNENQKEKIILLVETPKEISIHIEKGLKIQKVNVGGMHYKQGKRRLAPYIFVDEDDITSFKKMGDMQIELEGQDVPTAKKIDILKALKAITEDRL